MIPKLLLHLGENVHGWSSGQCLSADTSYRLEMSDRLGAARESLDARQDASPISCGVVSHFIGWPAEGDVMSRSENQKCIHEEPGQFYMATRQVACCSLY